MTLLGALGLLSGAGHAFATQKEFTSGTSLTSASNYTPTGAPASTDNILFDAAGGALTISAASLNVEDIAYTSATTTSISNTTSGTGASTLTLNGGRGNSVPLFDENTTKTFTIKNGSTGALNLVLAASGSFQIDNSGGLTISSNIGQLGGSQTLSVTGAGGGVVLLSGTNSFSGGLVALGAEVDAASDPSLGAAGGSLTINGGRIGFTTTFTVDPTRNIYLGANTSGGNKTGTLSVGTGLTTTINQPLQDLTGAKGDLVKQGSGTLVLGGASTYSDNTFLSNGAIKIAVANALPSTTTLALGQAASTNVGTLDLNGFSQQIAGLNSTSSTTMTPTTKNTVTTSSTAATLTLGGSGAYNYGDGSATNSGVLTGALALTVNLTGSGIQTLADNNTYTGLTTVSGGTLKVAATGTNQALGGTAQVVVNNSGTLLFGSSNQIKTGAIVTLGGGTGTPAFKTGGFSQDISHALGALTLSGNANLDLGSGSSTSQVAFANSSAQTWTGTLSILNYTGQVEQQDMSITGTAADSFFIGTDGTGLTQAQLAEISFVNPAGYNGTFGAFIGGNGEIYAAVPEPATVFSGLLMIGALGWNQRRRLRGLSMFLRQPRVA